jgi:ABC-type lipoprotein release transport system permease subunit
MRMVILFSIRNLFRQKRRSILLITVMAFVMMILIMANSLGAGMSDIIINKVLVKTIGHLQVYRAEKFGKEIDLIRDKSSLIQLIKDKLDGVTSVNEKSRRTWIRALGNGKRGNITLDGITPTPEFFDTLKLEQGDKTRLTNMGLENPVIINKRIARKLNVGINDYVKVRLNTIYGQSQTAKLLVTGITEDAPTMFMNSAVYIDIKNMKNILGYKENEAEMLMVTLNKPDTTMKQSEKLYALLQPPLAFMECDFTKDYKTEKIALFSYKTNSALIQTWTNKLKLNNNQISQLSRTNQLICSEKTAKALGIKTGDKIKLSWKHQFDPGKSVRQFVVGAVYQTDISQKKPYLLMNETDYYTTFSRDPPPGRDWAGTNQFIPLISSLGKALTTEWIMFPLVKTPREFQQKYLEYSNNGWKGVIFYVNTMYVQGNDVLQYSTLIDYFTFFSILILFFICMVGIVNTLRMTIKERTREIGTIRAIGMQKNQVRNMFLVETLFLSFFASIIGSILAFIGMGILSRAKIITNSYVFGIFIIDNHLYFVTHFLNVALYMAALLIASALAAFFPARRASNLLSAEALRHYE